jgi:hypothetical protein
MRRLITTLVSILIISISFSCQASYTQRGHKLRFFKSGKAQFVTVGII